MPLPSVAARPRSTPRVVRRWVLLAWFSAAFAGVVAAADAGLRRFDIPAGAAVTTIKRAALQAGLEIVYSASLVQGVQTPAVLGDFRPHEGIGHLLAGTGLRLVEDRQTGVLSISRLPDEPPKARPADSIPPPSGISETTQQNPAPMKSRSLLAALAGWLAAGAAYSADGTALPAGTIEGRVFNPSVGAYVSNARVSVDALRIETATDEFGSFLLGNVPAGEVVVRVQHTGFPAETRTVQVTAGRATEQNFDLRAVGEKGDLVRLDAFTVAARRDMAASDIAVNEQRYSNNIRNVVSTDSFGDIAEGSVGEFAKFLPGVTLGRNGSDGVNLSIGGLPPANTPITLDGSGIASAASSNPSRTVELDQLTITNMSRVEVTRSQNPDNPASAIGGSVNLVSRSAFERAKPEYSLKAYASFRGGDFSFSEKPNPFNKRDYPFEPNFELNAVVPLSKHFGIAVSGLVTRALNNGQGTLMTWVPNGAGQSTAFPATTVDKPYLVRYRLQERPKITVRESTSLSADWRFSPGNVLSFGFQYAFYDSWFWVRQLNFDVGSVASFGPDFTQGTSNAGVAQIITDARRKVGTTYMPSLRWKHSGPVWDWQLSGAFSRASNHYRAIDSGWFQNNNAYYRGLTIRFEQMGYDHPGVVSVKDAAGRDLNPYSLANYKLETVSSLGFNGYDIVRSLAGFAKRDFNLKIPVTMKVGVDYRSQLRDMRRPTSNYGFVGKDGLAATADDSADQWFDPVFSSRNMLYGPKMQWFDLGRIGAVYKTTPSYFNQSVTNQVNEYRTGVTTSQSITESITAPYLRLDAKLFNNRLQLTGGVRYERTDDDGEGPLIDPTRIYQRNAAGLIVRDGAGRPVVVAPLATLAGTQLAYVERGAKTKKAYGDFFPTLNGSVIIRPDLIARFSFGHSISRPDFGNILPSVNLPDTETTARTITLTNPALEPWTANSYGAALEYYFSERSAGVVSARVYRRDIRNFWGTTLTPATDALLEPWGLDPAVYGEKLGYFVSTTQNVGSARVSGAEFDYRQNLTFLPGWARGFTAFANLTLQHLEGNQLASFTGFVGKTTNWGLSFSRPRFTVRLAVNLKGLVKQGQVINAGTEPGTFTYLMPRNSADLSLEYRLTRKLSVFASGRNVNEATDDTVVYGPSTARDRMLSSRADYRAYWNVGLKGTF